ncbi:MAG TPA: glycosyltransferase family 4 protein [Chthoniobacterales bacterium]
MIYVWVNKRDWGQPGPIVNVGLRNAYALAGLALPTHFFVGAGVASDTDRDLREHYGLRPLPTLTVHRVARTAFSARMKKGRTRKTSSGPVFRAAARFVTTQARHEKVAVITREASFLPHLAILKWRHPGRVLGFYEAHDFHGSLAWRRAHQLPVKSQDVRQSILERLCLPRLDGLVCITEEQRKLFRGAFPATCSCALPLGTEPFPPTVDPEARRRQRRAVYVGRLSRGKGRDLLLAAAPALVAARVKLAFWGGNAEQARDLHRLAEERGLVPWVEVVPSRSPKELQRALAAEASIGLAPLADNAYNRCLTCPVKALDYLSHGLPTVASDLPSTREVLAGAGTYVQPEASEALSTAIIGLLDDAEQYGALSRAAVRQGLNLSWMRRAERLVEFIGTAR